MKKQYKSSYIFPATVEKTTANYGVYFSDFPGCVAIADTLDDVLQLAREGLALHLWGIEQDDGEIPAPSPIEHIKTNHNEIICLLDINMFEIRNKMNNRSVKKTLTVPWYLNEIAEKKKINFSQVLQAALRERLGIQ